MNEENHIIQFEHTFDLYENLHIIDDFYIYSYIISKNRQSFINILYLNLDAYSSIPSNYYYIFNLSNMLYKLHTKEYYSGILWNKELI